MTVGVALAKTFTVQVARNAKVTSQTGTTTSESVVVDAHGRVVYTLTGDSPRHPECTKANHATGEGIHSFGGTWHVIRTAGGSSAGRPLSR